MTNIHVWIPLVAAFVGFMLGGVIAYSIGREDGEDEAARYYEAKNRGRV